MPDIFAAPYAYLEPELIFVLDDGERAVGYLLGASDTPRFVHEFRERRLPLIAEHHPAPVGEPVTRDEQMAALLHWPERMIVPDVADYPAHRRIYASTHLRIDRPTATYCPNTKGAATAGCWLTRSSMR